MWKEITNKQKWNSLISSQQQAQFLQSYEWGEFQESWNRKVLRFSFDDKIFVQAIKMNLPLGKFYWYIARGPIVLDKSADLKSAMQELSEELKKHGALFLRIDPSQCRDVARNVLYPTKPVASTQPQCTRILDLSKDEETLLSEMHQKTRYNIRLAEKKGVEISQGLIDDFLLLNSETSKRDKFTSHPDSHYKNMVKSLPKDFIKIWQAKYQGKILASNIVIYFGDTATYTHGASSNQNRELMAPYLLQWKIIQHAKSKGFKKYDFYGVNPEDENHDSYKKSWQGISRFKAGFSGNLVCYPHSFDLISNDVWYRLYTLFSRIKRIFF